MAQIIALFNHKGGVSKTTTVFNLGWMLAEKGKRVVIVDSDPQCNLTGMILGYRGENEFEEFYRQERNRDLKSGLSPAFESMPRLITPIECIPIEERAGLYLLPGHIGLAEYEVTLGISQQLSGTIPTLKNLPGAINYLFNKTADRYNADYIIVDMGPSLSAINQNILMTSDFFIIPTIPDYFSVMALNSLTTIIPKWHQWYVKARDIFSNQQADYPLPNTDTKFLGTIIQRFRPRGGRPARGFQNWIDEINRTVTSTLKPKLIENNMLLPGEAYAQQDISEDCCLATISDFNSLITQSQELQTPIFAITDEQLNRTGPVLEQLQRSRDTFYEDFSLLSEKIIGLTSNANRH